MSKKIPVVFVGILIAAIFAITDTVSASPVLQNPTPRPTPTRRVATAAELQKAKLEWSQTAHAETFDNGQGANTTCARCKSPMNWDPQAPAQTQALNCAACKRVSGAPRPDLEGGVPVSSSNWKNVGCEICHEPVGNSYYTAVLFWNQASGKYEPVASVTELCAKCHEGTHGFEVITEQQLSSAHKGWECTKCHGAHNTHVACTDCHNPTKGRGATEHARHPQVNCTACHDAGGLSVGYEIDASSRLAARHLGTYITLRFAHTLTSWPSHNLQTAVDCRRCHHPQGTLQTVVAAQIGCDQCHPEGAGLLWCTFFTRNPDPLSQSTPGTK